MDQIITCINCPVGCRMKVEFSENGEFLSVTGNTCPRGSKYALQECTMPVRMITAVIPVKGCSVPLSVKTSQPVPKDMVFSVMREISDLNIKLPVKIGQVVLNDVLQTGADIVATRNLE